MDRVLGALAALAAGALTPHAANANTVIIGTFSGLIESGIYTVDEFGSPLQNYDLAGGQFSAFYNVNEDFGPYEGDVSFLSPGGEGNGAGPTAVASASAANGVVSISSQFFGNNNNSVAVDLKADVVNGALLNWRGALVGSGQIGNSDIWEADATFSNLTFVGTYAGPIPEPATWAMMIAGFGLAGASLRRNKAAALG